MAEYERKIRQILADNNCSFVRRGKGDHDIWYSPITDRNITVDSKSNHGIPQTLYSNKPGFLERFALAAKAPVISV